MARAGACVTCSPVPAISRCCSRLPRAWPAEPAWCACYPGLLARGADPRDFYASYAATYIERDVRQIFSVQQFGTLQRFVQLAAARIGELVNFASLAAWLLGIHEPELLAVHPQRGALFENFVVGEIVKYRFNHGNLRPIHFWRDANGREVDLVLDDGPKLLGIEIKSGATFAPDWTATSRSGAASSAPMPRIGRSSSGAAPTAAPASAPTRCLGIGSRSCRAPWRPDGVR